MDERVAVPTQRVRLGFCVDLETPRMRLARLWQATWTGLVMFALLISTTAAWADDDRAHDPAAHEPAERPVSYVRTFVSDLALENSPPTTSLTAFVGSHLPYQVGVGVAIDAWLTPAVRLGLVYAFGATPSNNDAVVSNYAEASASVRVLHVASSGEADLPLRPLTSDEPNTVRTLIPAHHSLYAEGGILTGLIALARCTANCDRLTTPPVLREGPQQLIMPFGGLRYVYLKSASSAQGSFRALSTVQVYAHVIARPFNASGDNFWKWTGERERQLPLGVRLGFDAPPLGMCVRPAAVGFKCAEVGFAVGVNPVPRAVLVDVHIGYSIY